LVFKEDISNLETRRRIYNFILEYPGLHFRNLSKKLNIPRSTLEYHLRYLKSRRLLTTEPIDNYTYYYVNNNIGTDQKKMLHFHRREVPRNIIIFLLFHFCASQIELSKCLEKHPTTIEFHLKKLLDAGIIEQAPTKNGKVYTRRKFIKIIIRASVKNEIIYRLKDPRAIFDSLVIYKKNSIGVNFIDYLIEVIKFKDSINFRPPVLSEKEFYKSFIGVLFNVFPHPYHA